MIIRGSGEFETTVTDVDGNEHEVVVAYGGYSDPGVCSGPVERCYAPEGECEIIVKGAPTGVEVDESEYARLEDEAWDHLVNDKREREYDPRD